VELGSVSDIVTAAATAGLAGAAIFAAHQGVRALGAWRDEAVGKRKIEIAEQVLADFYEAHDIINGARLPVAFEGEGSTRPKSEGESEGRKRRMDSYYVVLERLSRREEFFARLFARRYRFVTLFGLEAGKPFNELFAIRNDLMLTVNFLVGDLADMLTHEERRRMEAKIGWGDPKDDPIREKLDRVVQTVEQICRPIIQANA
jgi:hypothetical protein